MPRRKKPTTSESLATVPDVTLKQLENLLDGFSGKVKDWASQLESQIAEIKNQLAASQSTLQKREKAILDLNERLAHSESELNQAQLNLQTNQDSFADQKKELETLIQKLRAELTEKNDQMTQIQLKLEAVKNVEQSQIEKLDALQRDLESEKSKYQKLQKTNAGLRGQNTQKMNKIKSLEGKNRDAIDQINAAAERETKLINERDVLKSSLETTRLDHERLNKAQDESEKRLRIDITRQMVECLSKLAVLSGKEPQEVRGMTVESVFHDLKESLEKVSSMRLKFFPTTKELDTDNICWLNADDDGLETLIAKYDWTPERPFEGLESGQRFLPFQLVRHGWVADGEILKRAVVTPIKMDEVEHEG